MSEDKPPEAFELPPELVERIGPADMRDTDRESNQCQHTGCTNAIVRTGKGGRPPKYCPEHKNRDRKPSNRSETSGKTWARATEIETILSNYVGYLGFGLRLVNPADGKVIADNGPAVIHELVELAKTDTKLRRPLEMLATPGKYGPLGLSVLAVIMPIMSNHGLLPQFQIDGLTPSPEPAPGLRVV